MHGIRGDPRKVLCRKQLGLRSEGEVVRMRGGYEIRSMYGRASMEMMPMVTLAGNLQCCVPLLASMVSPIYLEDP